LPATFSITIASGQMSLQVARLRSETLRPLRQDSGMSSDAGDQDNRGDRKPLPITISSGFSPGDIASKKEDAGVLIVNVRRGSAKDRRSLAL